jgi:subtilisin family serine protease
MNVKICNSLFSTFLALFSVIFLSCEREFESFDNYDTPTVGHPNPGEFINIPEDLLIVSHNLYTSKKVFMTADKYDGVVWRTLPNLGFTLIKKPQDDELREKLQAALLALPGVNFVEADQPLIELQYVVDDDDPEDPHPDPSEREYNYWQVKIINLEDAHVSGLMGDPDVLLLIIDTGICPGHSEVSVDTSVSYDIFTGTNTTEDVVGHGTFIAGLISAQLNGAGIVGVAPRVRIGSVRIFLGPYTTLSAVLMGLEWAVSVGPDIINCS